MNLDQFITAASDYARRVDETFWMLTAISAVIIILLAVLILTFIIRYRRGSDAPRGELPKALRHEIEIGWTAATLLLFLFMFWWAAVQIAHGAASAEKRAGNPRRRQAVDVALPASDRRARDRRAACAGRHAGTAGDDIAGRHPRPLSAGVALEAGHLARPLHLSVVQRRQRPACSISPARNFAAPTIRSWPAQWTFSTPAGLCALDRGAAGRRRSRPSGRGAVSIPLGCSGCHDSRESTCTRPICTASTDTSCSSPTGAPSPPMRLICGTASCCRSRDMRRRLYADDMPNFTRRR